MMNAQDEKDADSRSTASSSSSSSSAGRRARGAGRASLQRELIQDLSGDAYDERNVRARKCMTLLCTPATTMTSPLGCSAPASLRACLSRPEIMLCVSLLILVAAWGLLVLLVVYTHEWHGVRNVEWWHFSPTVLLTLALLPFVAMPWLQRRSRNAWLASAGGLGADDDWERRRVEFVRTACIIVLVLLLAVGLVMAVVFALFTWILPPEKLAPPVPHRASTEPPALDTDTPSATTTTTTTEAPAMTFWPQWPYSNGGHHHQHDTDTPTPTTTRPPLQPTTTTTTTTTWSPQEWKAFKRRAIARSNLIGALYLVHAAMICAAIALRWWHLELWHYSEERELQREQEDDML